MIRIHLDHFDRSGATPISLAHRRDNLYRLARSLPCDLLDATPDVLDQWQSGLLQRRTRRGETLARSTVSTYSVHAAGFYRWAFEAGHLEQNPAARLPRIRLSRGRPHPIPEGDLQAALICAPPRIRTWLLLAAFMGLRAMEVAQLRRDSFTETDGRLVLSAVGKGRKSFSMVVPKHIEADVRSWLVTDSVLWRTQSGAAVSPKYVSRTVGDFFRRLGQPYTLHWARHSFGTAAYAQTRDLLLTQDLMRHSSPETTRIYVQTGGRAGVRAMDKLAARSLRPRSAHRRPRPSGDDQAGAAA
ncbi:phage integrase, site-specific tyrosine recombinase [Pseudonocardia sp. N23]|nr:phage integrase, site-specific tyrosine recombinase [Pseudonocardia sp. N23]